VTAVRAAQPGDLPALTDIYNHYVLTSAVTFDTTPFTVEARRDWFSHYATTGSHRLLVAADGDDVLGYATSSAFRAKPAYVTSVEATVYLHSAATGRGLGTLLYTALFDALREEDVHRVYAGVALPNEASLALHERMGFHAVGTFVEVGRKFGRYWDVRWFELELP
jgi:phosphinothricin acetyltransferase